LRYTQGLGIDEPLVRQTSTSTVYYEADGLGSITSLTTTAGAVTMTYSYDSFGVSTGTTGSETNPYRYTGREIDARTMLHYYRARYYAPNVGRFVSEDPIGFGGGINFYGFVRNSPLNGTDPSGLWSPRAHDQMVWNALSPCGVSDADIYEIQRGSRSVDQDYQGAEYAYMHSMSNGNISQSASKAVAQRNSFVQVEVREAIADFAAGDRNQAMFVFGIAMHPVMDMTSPAHTDRNGNPIPWCGLTGCANNRGQVLEHSPNDLTGIERVQDLNANPEIQRLENQLIRGYFESVTGQKLRCDCKK